MFMGGFLSSSLCISYEAKSLQMKKERILREYFLGFQDLLCNCEVNLAERLSELCVPRSLLHTTSFYRRSIM